MKLIAATGNKGKVSEIRAILGKFGCDIVSMKELGIDADIEENGKSFCENALIKARAIQKITSETVIADDSGLCVDALGGAPGIYSARYAGEGAGDMDRIKKLLMNMKGVEESSRGAHFVSAVAVVMADGREFVCEGKVFGRIGYKPEGDNGFGYDPIFICDETGKTFASMSDEQKNVVSHRYRALKKMKDVLLSEGIL